METAGEEIAALVFAFAAPVRAPFAPFPFFAGGASAEADASSAGLAAAGAAGASATGAGGAVTRRGGGGSARPRRSR